ncbi:MAG: hypothetical protein QOF48_2432, partial [Verrucomicrobiota bacterium]
MKAKSLFLCLGLMLAGVSARAASVSFFDYGTSWKYVLGTSEASTPMNAWRAIGFNDAAWSAGPAPIGYDTAGTPGTSVPIATTTPTSTAGNFLSIYFRKSFSIANVGEITSASLTVAVDDGAVVWLNGVEVGRVNVPDGELGFNGAAITAAEVNTLTTTNIASLLVSGNNVVAVHAFNANLTSSDLVMEASFSGVADQEAPTIINRIPAAGQTVQTLSSIEIVFSEAVTGVNASDLLLNNIPATNLLFGVPGQFVFEFAAPATGVVNIAFAGNHGIADFAVPAHPFVASPWTYTVDPNANPGTFRISEFLASNSKGIRDEDGDRVDWIEIYNPSTTANLQGWALTDDPLNLGKWKFPYTVLNANNYLIVYASSKNRTNTAPGAKLHTGFSLDADGGYLALVDGSSNVISVFNPYPAQSPDISYGRDLGNSELVGFYSTPTPGNPNSTQGTGIAPAVTFSHSSRTFLAGSPFSLSLTTPGVGNASIYYALGTNLPGSNTLHYTGSLTVSTTTVIRARAFVPGKLPGPVRTMSYIALSPANASLTYMTNVVTFNSGLPVMILHNYGQGVVPANSDAEQHVIWQTFDNDSGRSSLTNLPSQTGRGVFHARGSSTLTSSAAKAQFLLETRDDLNNDFDVPLLGFPKQSDWVLYAPNNFEPALMHNPLAHAWYRDLGRYGSRTRFVEVFLQDDATPGSAIAPADYQGIYVLEEKIKRDANRVDIARLDAEDVTAPAITGGYLLSIDRQDTGKPALSGLTFATPSPINFLSPSALDMTNAARAPQIAYIRDYLNSFNTAINNNNTWTNPVTGYAAYIDVPTWIDLHIHEVVTFNVDAMRLSGYFYKDRNKKMQYGPTWDYDRTEGSTDGRDANPRVWANSGGTDFFNFTPWWNRLLQAPDFWQAWVDRYQEMREGTNALSATNINAHIQRFYDQLVQAQPRELARWNIQPRGANGSGVGTYATEVQWKRNWYSNRCDYADNQFLAKPSFNVLPGQFSNTFTVTVTPVAGFGDHPAGSQLFVSLDGSDPRLSGGGIATGPNILSNTGPITITVSNTVRLFARSRNTSHVNATGTLNPPISSPWSGPTAGTYYYPALMPPLRITEIMYNPPKAPPGNATNDSDNFEYIEFRNTSASSLNVTGYRIRGGVNFDFPSLTLAAGQSCVVVADQAAFQSRYGVGPIVAGSYTNDPGKNRLGNAGDHLKLEGFYREPILDFSYSDSWFPSTDGAGFALQIVNDALSPETWGLKSSWRASGSFLGTPGSNDSGVVAIPQVVVNEVLTHTDLPQVDAVELYNPGASAAAVGGWFLTDDFNTPKKYKLANGLSVPAGGYLVLYSDSSFGVSFDLGSRGEEIYLFSGDGTNLTGYVQGFDFGAQANGVTFGRYITSTGIQYPVQISPTLGSANSGPKVGPIVISEIMYHPPDISTVEGPRDNDRDEYVELENITGQAQPLYDPLSPENTWRLRDAISFTFPTNVSIPAMGHLLVVSFDPIADPLSEISFRARNGVFGGASIFGPYSGQLDNSGDAVELVRPDRPQPPEAADAGAVYDILVDKVNYSQNAPWPTGADGFGFSLQRIVPGSFGNDPTNWTAGVKSPGYSDTSGSGPVITQQPQSISVLGTQPASFSVMATGAPPIFYQWFFGNSGITGATNTVYSIPSVGPGNAGTYRCLAQNSGGATFSATATLTYITPANITEQPATVEVRVRPDPGSDVAPTTNSSF